MSKLKLAKEGDICQSCYPFWAHQSLPGKRLLAFTDDDNQPYTTERKKMHFVYCPWCDGDIQPNHKAA